MRSSFTPIAVRVLKPLFAWVVAGTAVLLAPVVHGHGDDQQLIDALTEELTKAPEADLFIRRGELFRHHQEWSKADADYVSAARLDPKLTVVDFFRARVLLESGDAAKARLFVDRYVAQAPDEPEGRFLRGDVLANLGQHEAGILEYVEGLKRTSLPRPEHYLRRAKFLAAIPNADPKRILASLDEGIARVGPAIPLLDAAIELELEQKDYDGALKRVTVAMEHSPRRETWLVRQGDILVKSGRIDEAGASYRAALAAIDALPPRYRETVPMEKVARDANVALGQLNSGQRN